MIVFMNHELIESRSDNPYLNYLIHEKGGLRGRVKCKLEYYHIYNERERSQFTPDSHCF